MYESVIFREYDIRGVYNTQFDDDFALKLGKAFAVYLAERAPAAKQTVALGYDARLSSPAIVKALSQGLAVENIFWHWRTLLLHICERPAELSEILCSVLILLV